MVKLAAQCKQSEVSIVPSALFSATGKYRNCMRLNCMHLNFSEQTEIERERGIRHLASYTKGINKVIILAG